MGGHLRVAALLLSRYILNHAAAVPDAILGTTMRLDFSHIPLTDKAFSDQPMAFCEPQSISVLSAIVELIAIETGDRTVRERWQVAQLRNLLKHAAANSAFWKKRIGTRNAGDIELSSLPALTRSEIREQVRREAALLMPNPVNVRKHASSGSTGVPVEFFISEMNGQFNEVRSLAQHFLEGRDFSLNRVRLRPEPIAVESGISVERAGSWMGPLEPFIRSGTNRTIKYFHPDWGKMRQVLEGEPVGYMVAQNGLVETLLQHFGPSFFKRAGVAMWIPIADGVDQNLRDIFASLDIPIRATYSAEEVGMIGAECDKNPGHYHVATSNVIVEVDANEQIGLAGAQVGRVLVTHLHSYATPFIRYDIGDLASHADRCACGHDGPVLSNIFGRSKNLLKHADGRVSIFYVRGQELHAIAKFDEYRIRQVDVRAIIVEIAGGTALSPDEVAAVTRLVRSHAGDEFQIEVKSGAKIDWGHSVKRLAYHSEVM